MQLIPPSPEYKESFRQALEEFKAAGIVCFWNVRDPLIDIDRYIIRTERNRQGLDIPEGWVPASTFWLIDNDEFIAHVNIRHVLNDRLRQIGGHIGYFVRPPMHGKGYGTKLLTLALLKARELGIEQVLITCDKGNIASRRVVEKNGGVFEKEIETDGKKVLHFLIKLD